MEYKGLILSTKCPPDEMQLQLHSTYQHIELSMPLHILEDGSKREQAIDTANKFRKKHDLHFSLHCPYDGVNGSYAYFYDSYEFARRVNAEILIIHPCANDRQYENYNGITIALEIVRRLCNPQEVLDYIDKYRIDKVVFDSEHVKSAELPVIDTFNKLYPNIVGIHYSNTSVDYSNSHKRYHEDIVGGIIPLSDFRHLLMKLKKGGSKARNVIEVREEDWNVPTKTKQNLKVLMELIDSLEN